MQVSDLIQKLGNTYKRDFVQLIKCTVTSYNENDSTITCMPITSNFLSNITVNLSVAEGNNIELIPSIGSVVLIGYTDNGTIELLSVADADKINISSNLDISFNGGEFGGLVKINELLTKINNLENIVNSLISLYNIHVHATNGAPTVSLQTTTLTPTILQDIENKNITHGE